MTKSLKRFLLSGLSLGLLATLSGCVSVKNGKPVGFIWDTIGKPMADLITYLVTEQGMSFGMGIIITTLVVRLIILPLGLYQSYKASYQSEKMAYLKPIFDPINERMRKATTQEEKLAAQSDLLAAQKENGVSMFGGIGCLPMLIQLPFFSAIFVAVRHTAGVSESHFLGLNLGERSLVLTAIIAALYFLQSWLSMRTVPEEQREQMKSMMYSMPLMMVAFGFSSPASILLYWLVGGIFSIIQQLITMVIIKPRLRAKVAAEFEKNPPKPFKSTQATRRDVTPSPSAAVTTSKTNRNAGKQRRKK